ncbi:hypothetical protein VIGAN_01267200 [Vigna angularis var. angularis]|uniref:Uncharacterized protein n=1 Tax=Vigna angularis var. angularis TaxID=157739 RepID=A0A0S3R330_PHAAN|nr:hypothetical protein VIGAN_01267200 [Vigna angularis var. angularis]
MGFAFQIRVEIRFYYLEFSGSCNLGFPFFHFRSCNLDLGFRIRDFGVFGSCDLGFWLVVASCIWGRVCSVFLQVYVDR